MYIWQQATWPEFTWDDAALSTLLAHVNKEQGRLKGKLEAMEKRKTEDRHFLTNSRFYHERKLKIADRKPSEVTYCGGFGLEFDL